jgi:Flp pilus assembly protein TadG
MKVRHRFPHHRGGGTEGGQATVEFAFLLPLVVFAALAVIQIGLVVRDQMGVVHAAREAARAASVDADPARATRAAHRTLPGSTVEVGARPKVGGEVTVTVRYTSVTNLPLVGALFPDPELHASATMRVER